MEHCGKKIGDLQIIVRAQYRFGFLLMANYKIWNKQRSSISSLHAHWCLLQLRIQTVYNVKITYPNTKFLTSFVTHQRHSWEKESTQTVQKWISS